MANENLIALLMNQRNVEVIIGLADNNLNLMQTCRAIYWSPTTVRKRIRKIKQMTGLDPQNFHDLCKLLQIVGERKDNG